MHLGQAGLSRTPQTAFGMHMQEHQCSLLLLPTPIGPTITMSMILNWRRSEKRGPFLSIFLTPNDGERIKQGTPLPSQASFSNRHHSLACLKL